MCVLTIVFFAKKLNKQIHGFIVLHPFYIFKNNNYFLYNVDDQ